MGQPSWIGSTLGGRYKIEALLGQGGMAGVYKGTDPNLRRTVAIKLIHPHLADDPAFVRRFEEEAAAVARLRHPNIVQVFDFDHDGNLYYMVLEFVPGETLQDRLKTLSAAGKQLPLEETLEIMAKVCDAVAYAHERGMIHRDLKPANVMLGPQGQPILMDFGIAKILGGTQHTATGAIVGTAAYMSPEQIQGAPLDPRSDIYSLGVMLFEMAIGHPPFEGDSAMTIMLKHIQQPVPDLRRDPSGAPAPLVAVIEKALAKKPEDRFQTGAEMAGALRMIQSHLKDEVSEVQLRINTFLDELQSGGKDRKTAALEFGQTPAPAAKPEGTPFGQTPGTEVRPRPSASAGSTVLQPAPTSVMSPPMPKATGASDSAQSEKKRGVPLVLLIALIILGLICVVGVVGASIFAATGGFGGAAKGSSTPTLGGSISTATAIAAVTDAVVSPTPTPTLEPTIEPTATTPPLPVGMVLVPAGTFNMGSADGGPEEAPVHSVTLDAFLLDQYEVTNARYEKCVDAGACTPPASTGSFARATYYGNSAFLDFPVIQVTWNQAAAFCNWEESKRLPTEAEWEYAARGPDGRRFPWGSDFDPSLLPVNEPDTVVVGNYAGGVSPFEVYDLAGNVLEWVADWYDANYYAQSPTENPTGPEVGNRRVLRGGSFGNPDGRFYLSARRYRQPPSFHDTDVGFRCAANQ